MDLFIARCKLCAWVALKMVLGVIYVSVISDGLRILLPDLGKKLYKLPIPYANLLENDEVGHRLDLAHVFALFLLIAVFFLWSWLIRTWLRPGEEEDDGWDATNYQRLVFALAVVIISADTFIFYRALVEYDWGGGSVSTTCVVATVAYAAIQVFVSFVSVVLDQQVRKLLKESKS
jgi:hypothetical protein